MKCKLCNFSTTSYQGLARHISYRHNLSSKEYYDTYIKSSKEGLCICGKPTPFLRLSKGYQNHCSIKCAQIDPNTNNKFRNSNPQKDSTIKNKTKETCKNRYGVDCVLKNNQIRHKIINTCKIKYGVENPFQIEYSRKLATENSHNDIAI